MTCDAQHMWLEELSPTQPVSLTIRLDAPTQISMIRIWNYNHSRVHATMGVRELQMMLDGMTIFSGEVRCANGEIESAIDCAEILLYTMDETILGAIEANDEAIHVVLQGQAAEAASSSPVMMERPPTRGRNSDLPDSDDVAGMESITGPLDGLKMLAEANLGADDFLVEDDFLNPMGLEVDVLSPDSSGMGPLSPTSALVAPSHLATPQIVDRPPTVTSSRGEALDPPSAIEGGSAQQGLQQDFRPITACAPGSPAKRAVPGRQIGGKKTGHRPGTMMALGEDKDFFGQESPVPSTRFLRLELLETWGDVDIGVTAIEVLDQRGAVVPISTSALSIMMRDPKGGVAPHNDPSIKKLLDGHNLTKDEEHMWSTKFVPRMVISIDLGFRKPVKALKIFNYNASVDESFRGLKHFELHLDGLPGETYSTRKAPGTDVFDYGHQIDFRGPAVDEAGPRPVTAQPTRVANEALHSAFERARRRSSHNEFIRQDYFTPLLPYGFIIRLELIDTWGDPHYMGLNGLELYDCFNKKIPLDKVTHANPASVRHLAGMEGDVRTLDKLWDGVHSTRDDRHMWLVPNTLGTPTLVYVCLHEPVSLSKVKIWNYAKTPARGVKNVAVFVDDNMVYKGRLRCAEKAPASPSPQTILFTNDVDVMENERDNLYCTEDAEPGGEIVFMEGEESVAM